MKLRELFESTVYQEEEDSTVTSNKTEYNLNMLFRISADFPVTEFEVDRLKWVLKYCDTNGKRKKKADLTAPILVTKQGKRYVVLDGAHRLAKAVDEKIETLPGRFIDPALLPLAEIIADKNKPQ